GDFFTDVFVRDTQAGTTTLVSRVSGADGVGADGNSERPSISADGGSVAFESEANNLSALDDNSVRNIFLRELVGRPEGPGPGTPTPNPDRTPPGLGGSRAKSPQKL